MAGKLTLRGIEPEPEPAARPEFENGAVGTQNDARLALYDQIADQNDAYRGEDFVDIEDVTTRPAVETDEEAEAETEQAAPVIEGEVETDAEVEQEAEAITEPEPPAKRTIKVGGKEIQLTEEELIARAQKVEQADQYLAEASRIYRAAIERPSEQDASDDVANDAALARAIQLGTEEEAVKAIRAIRKASLPTGEIEELVVKTLEHRSILEARSRFQSEYSALLADPVAEAVVFAFDDELTKAGEPAGYERFAKAAEKAKERLGLKSSMDDKVKRKQAAPRPVVGGSARPAPEPEEHEPTVRDDILAMAKARHQSLTLAGN